MLFLLLTTSAANGAENETLRNIVARLQARVDAQEGEIAALRDKLPQPADSAADDACTVAPFAWPCAPSAESKTPARPFEQFDRIMMVCVNNRLSDPST